jgi:uncharacterized protein (DUF983 family)
MALVCSECGGDLALRNADDDTPPEGMTTFGLVESWAECVDCGEAYVIAAANVG